MTIATIAECYSGDTSDVWEVGFVESAAGVRPVVLADLDGNFTCRIAVLGSTIARAVTVKTVANDRFRAWLTPEETAVLGPGDWVVGVELRNPTLVPPLVKEVHRTLRIRAEAVPAV
jgi:hypothetical protein